MILPRSSSGRGGDLRGRQGNSATRLRPGGVEKEMSRISIYKILVVIGLGGFALFGAHSLGFFRIDDGRMLHGKGDFQSIGSALKAYAIQVGRPPTTEQGLEAVVARPTLEPLPENWVQVMFKAPMDPWRQPYHNKLLSEADGVSRWELRSAGPDGVTGNEDDRAQEFEWRGR